MSSNFQSSLFYRVWVTRDPRIPTSSKHPRHLLVAKLAEGQQRAWKRLTGSFKHLAATTATTPSISLWGRGRRPQNQGAGETDDMDEALSWPDRSADPGNPLRPPAPTSASQRGPDCNRKARLGGSIAMSCPMKIFPRLVSSAPGLYPQSLIGDRRLSTPRPLIASRSLNDGFAMT